MSKWIGGGSTERSWSDVEQVKARNIRGQIIEVLHWKSMLLYSLCYYALNATQMKELYQTNSDLNVND